MYVCMYVRMIIGLWKS